MTSRFTIAAILLVFAVASTEAARCANITAYTGSTCNTADGNKGLVCGACNKGDGTSALKVTCVEPSSAILFCV